MLSSDQKLHSFLLAKGKHSKAPGTGKPGGKLSPESRSAGAWTLTSSFQSCGKYAFIQAVLSMATCYSSHEELRHYARPVYSDGVNRCE